MCQDPLCLTQASFLLSRITISNRPYLERTDAEYVLLSTLFTTADLTKLLDQHLKSDADITMTTSTRYNDRDVVGERR